MTGTADEVNRTAEMVGSSQCKWEEMMLLERFEI